MKNKWRLILIVLSISLFVGIYNNVYVNKRVTINYPNGNKKQEFYRTKGEINGAVTSYYETGEIESLVEFKNGKQNGLALYFYKNRNIKKRTYFTDGIQSDTLISYFDNGQIESLVAIKNEKFNGTFNKYYKNGNLEFTGTYDSGKYVDILSHYDSTGTIWRQIFHEDTLQVFKCLYDQEKAEVISYGQSFKIDIPSIYKQSKYSANEIVFKDSNDINTGIIVDIYQSDQSLTDDIKYLKKLIETKVDDFTIIKEYNNLGDHAILFSNKQENSQYHQIMLFFKKDRFLSVISFIKEAEINDKDLLMVREIAKSYKRVRQDYKSDMF